MAPNEPHNHIDVSFAMRAQAVAGAGAAGGAEAEDVAGATHFVSVNRAMASHTWAPR